MKLDFQASGQKHLQLSLHATINEAIQLHPEHDNATTRIVLNFFDPFYSPDSGGYHPVEIAMNRENEVWNLEYMTDFAYYGKHYPELEKEIDINFTTGQVYSSFSGYLDQINGQSLSMLFITNFIEYYKLGVYTLKVTQESTSETV